MLQKVAFAIVFCISGLVYGQVGIGQWRSHTAGHQGFLVDQSNTTVFVSLGNSIMSYDKETGEVNNWNSVNFLTDIDVTALQYDKDKQILYVGYKNGNIDMIKGNTVYNLPAIRLSNIIGLKSIQRFVFNDGLAYVCTGFGVVVINPDKFEVKETYYPTANNYFVYDLAFQNGKIYVATESGIYQGLEGNPLLPAPGAWSLLPQLSTSQQTARFTELETHGDRLFFVRDSDNFNEDSLLYLENNQIHENALFPPSTYNNLYNQNDTLLISKMSNLSAFDTSFTEVMSIFQYPWDTYVQPMSAVISGENYMIADIRYGLVSAINSWGAQSYNTGGPYRTGSYRLDWQDSKLGTVSGYITPIGNNTYNVNGMNLFKDELWYPFHRELMPVLDTAYDFTCLAINPNNTNQVFFGTASTSGILSTVDGKSISTIYTDQNSAIQKRANYDDYYVISDMMYDYEGNLWIANSFCSEQLVVKTPDNLWYSYDAGSSGSNVLLNELFVDYYNLKWIGTKGNGIVVYDNNQTPDNTDDDRIKNITTSESNGALPSGDVLCITMDFDEEIWIGTTAGLAVIYSPQNIWDGTPEEYQAQRILVQRDGFTEILLGETPITDIEVDGANRKWIATQGSGVFLVSEDGTEEILHFTVENSPLLSNNVFDIDIDHKSGEVFIGTELGLVSYRSDATYGDFEFSDVYSYPNPVLPTFTGNVTILGFAYDTDVRITDIAGNLVYQTTSNGGTVLWNGKTTTGERVKSGVYVVWAGEKNDKGRAVTKILFIN